LSPQQQISLSAQTLFVDAVALLFFLHGIRVTSAVAASNRGRATRLSTMAAAGTQEEAPTMVSVDTIQPLAA
jgi:hypothetical protein